MSINPSFPWLFDSVAHYYEEHMLPVVEPLACDLVEWAAPQSENTVLDLGCGTGIAARLASPLARHVIAADLAHAMLVVARSVVRSSNLYLVQSDAHGLSLPSNSIDLVLSSFGLNATDPAVSLREIGRVLRPGGQLCFQEWGALHPLDALVADVLEIYAVYDEDADPELVALRDFLAEDRLWYRDLQDEDDFVTMLTAMGFVGVEAREYQPVALELPVELFMDYRLTWTSRRLELAAMDESARGDCIDRMRSLLYEHTDANGHLRYDPALFRIRAYGPV